MLKTILIDKQFYTEKGQKEFNRLFKTKAKIFQAPKSPFLLAQLFETITADSDLILDFFAGSGSSGQAAMMLNARDRAKRRYICVQLPEPIDPENKEQAAAADFLTKLKLPLTIAEITKQRLRYVIKDIREHDETFVGDLGFRVFKLASSNIQAWEPERDRLAETLEASVDHLKTDRTESDILYELLLKLGLDLTVPIETRTIAEQQVHSIGAGTLIVCLSKTIAAKNVESLALGIAQWHKVQAPSGESTVVFRDSAFPDDVAKTNLTAILQQYGLGNVRSL